MQLSFSADSPSLWISPNCENPHQSRGCPASRLPGHRAGSYRAAMCCQKGADLQRLATALHEKPHPAGAPNSPVKISGGQLRSDAIRRLVRSLRMFFVFRRSHASSCGVLFAHVGPSLCAAIVPMAAEVINPGFRIRPHNGVAWTTRFCLRRG